MQQGTARDVVHVHGGRHLLERLAAAGVPGARLEWCDPVAFGPTPAGLGLDDDAWLRVRAAYIASAPGAPPVAQVEADRRAQDEALRAVPPDHEVVTWAGPELFCQAILMRLLVLLGDRSHVSLVEPGDRPSSPGCGLDALTNEELAAAFAQRRPATPEMTALARRAWAAFTAPSARALAGLLQDQDALHPLPFLGAALSRHLDDLPDGGTGLSTTETRLLERLARGPAAPRDLLKALAAREARPFLTNEALAEIVTRLAGGPAPLVTIGADGLVSVTKRADDVLTGADVWFARRWHGGVEITPDEEEDRAPADA